MLRQNDGSLAQDSQVLATILEAEPALEGKTHSTWLGASCGWRRPSQQPISKPDQPQQ